MTAPQQIVIFRQFFLFQRRFVKQKYVFDAKDAKVGTERSRLLFHRQQDKRFSQSSQRTGQRGPFKRNADIRTARPKRSLDIFEQ